MNWIEHVLSAFPAGETALRLTLVEDPDTLLAEAILFKRLIERDYRVEVFSSALQLRHLYETTVRETAGAKVVVIFRGEVAVDEVVPYDIRTAPWTHRVSYSMSRVFTNLDYSVLRELDRQLIKDLCYHLPETVERGGGREATCEFIFEDILGVSATSANTLPRLFEALCLVHVWYAITSPKLLAYFSEKVRNKVNFKALTPNGILTNAAVFRDWVTQAWETRFLGHASADGHAGHVPPSDAELADQLNFGDARVRETMQHLFRQDWISMRGDVAELGKQYDYLAAGRRQGETMLDLPLQELEQSIPIFDAEWTEWIAYARKWAAFTALADSRQIGPKRMATVEEAINAAFSSWLFANYDSLAAIPGANPVMVYHVPSVLARIKRKEGLRKIALIVMDGLAWNQWVPMRQQLEEDFALSITGTFACVPTLTSVSRQAIFSGQRPSAFAASIRTTAKEPMLWKQVWQTVGVDPSRVWYEKGLGFGNPHAVKDAVYTNVEVAGMVVDVVDQFAHGATGGNVEMHARLKAWLDGGYLKTLLHDLVDELGFEVFIASDHGNIACRGTGVVREGVLANMKGERVRVYPNDVLRTDGLAKYAAAKAWNGGDLPTDFRPIVLIRRDAFVNAEEEVVSHGGVSIEECIVPFVRVGRKGSI